MGVPVDTLRSAPNNRLHIAIVDQSKHTRAFPRVLPGFEIEGDGFLDLALCSGSESALFVQQTQFKST